METRDVYFKSIVSSGGTSMNEGEQLHLDQLFEKLLKARKIFKIRKCLGTVIHLKIYPTGTSR